MERLPRGSASVIRRVTRLLLAALMAMALGLGCSTLHVAGSASPRDSQSAASKRSSAGQTSRKPAKKKQSWLASWFGPKEPPPPKSVKEWMQRSKQVRVTEPGGTGS